jgi:Zn-dependent protease with chaperone function
VTLALAAVVSTAIAVPHLLRLDRSSPAAAATIWCCALTLRAVTVVAAAVFVIVVLPTTELFGLVTHWCWHTVLPLLAAHLGLDGHRLGDAAVILPAFLLAASVTSVAFGVARAAGSVRAFVRQAELGPGPQGSVMVGGSDVIVAAAGLHRPQVLVSAGALVVLDDDELAVSLEHERGHIARRHRFVLVLAQLLFALSRPLPGTRRAMRELMHHLERDADAWALARRNDPLALASAICKAATASSSAAAPPVAAIPLGGGATTRRVRALADPGPRRRGRHAVRLLAAAMVAMTLMAGSALPAAAWKADAAASHQQRHCVA